MVLEVALKTLSVPAGNLFWPSLRTTESLRKIWILGRCPIEKHAMQDLTQLSNISSKNALQI